MWQGRGQAASGTDAQALLPQRARQAGKRRPQCARFRPKGAAEGSLRPSGLRRRATGGKCACAEVERSACPCPASLPQRTKPLPCRPLVQADQSAEKPPAWCSRLGWLLWDKLSSTLSRSRAKRGEAFSYSLWVLFSLGRHHTFKALHTCSRSRAKRGEAFSLPSWALFVGGSISTSKALHTCSRSRAKRGEACSPLFVFLNVGLYHHFVVIL